MQRHPRIVPLLAFVVSVGWTGFFLREALQRWRFERICNMTCGPFRYDGLVGLLRADMDWQTPLALAAIPVVLRGAWSLRRRRGGSIAAPQPR